MPIRPTIQVRVPSAGDERHLGVLSIDDWSVPCAVGAAGLVPATAKREGDRATPIGVFALRYGFFEPGAWPDFPRDLEFPFVPYDPAMMWSEDPADPDYNRAVFEETPDPARATARRATGQFDLFVPIGWNDAVPDPHRGSAIYLHVARPGLTPTAGCVAVAREHALALARRLVPGMTIDIAPLDETPVRAAERRMEPLESVTFTGLAPGPRLIVTGAVHGNEVAGAIAIRQAIDDIRAGRLLIRRGTVTFVPIVNALAHRRNSRAGDRNLNRDLREATVPTSYEDRVANVLCPLLRGHDVLLDLHSFRVGSRPFVFVGPADNDGPVEPFAQASAEGDFASRLGPELVMHGWLQAYVAAAEEKRRLIAAGVGAGGPLPEVAPSLGVGTTEYMRFAGGYAVTVECGQHDDPAAPGVARAAIRAALAHLRLIEAPPPPRSVRRGIEFREIVVAHSADDRLARDWRTGDPVAAGTVIARRADGTELTAPADGFIVFPNASPQPLDDLYSFGVPSERFRDDG